MTNRRRLPKVAPWAMLALAACGLPPEANQIALQDEDGKSGIHLHLRHDLYPGALRNAAAPAGAKLTYYGGPVLQNPKVVSIFWNANTQYQAQLNAFYQGILNSPYTAWLSEYNTGAPAQTIGPGSFGGSYVDTAATANTTDAKVQAEITRLINAGLVPAPDANTLYMVHFPSGMTITDSAGHRSCSYFCAYHGTYTRNGSYVYYGIIPDQGGSCAGGCGANPTLFNNLTSVTSHELVESITDPAVGLASTYAAPLAWYDSTNGEIGDICNAQQGSVVGSNGNTYTVQLEFSNQANNCIAQKVVSNDFTVALAPATATVTSGAADVTQTYTITTALSSGVAQAINLSVSGLSAGVTGSFSAATINSGDTATLTLTVPAGSGGSTSNFTVTATGAAATHTATGSLVVVGADFTLALAPATATVAAGAAAVTQAYTITSATAGNGQVEAVNLALSGLVGGVTGALSATTINSGDTATLTLTVPANAATTSSNFTVTGTAASGSHAAGGTLVVNGVGPANVVQNPGFEASATALTSWTLSGSASVSTTAHSGAQAALVGATGPTNTSSITQTFTAPTGTSKLSFWYLVACNDTVRYDWATATIKDNAANRTTTILPKTCTNNNTWVQVTTAVTAGKSYTLTLTNKDDNYPGDVTYTLYDDVSVQ